MFVRQEKIRLMKKFRCDISDIGNQIILLLEYLSKKPKKKENPMYRL
jgi:hypothetical protein